MNDTIKPALTAWQWAAPHLTIQAYEYDSDRNAAAEIVVGRGGELHITEHEHPRYGVIDTPEQRHALAALALRGMPFGFTHADVEAIRRVGERCDATSGADDDDVVRTDGIELRMRDVRRLQSLAARIAALLPPETLSH